MRKLIIVLMLLTIPIFAQKENTMSLRGQVGYPKHIGIQVEYSWMSFTRLGFKVVHLGEENIDYSYIPYEIYDEYKISGSFSTIYVGIKLLEGQLVRIGLGVDTALMGSTNPDVPNYTKSGFHMYIGLTPIKFGIKVTEDIIIPIEPLIIDLYVGEENLGLFMGVNIGIGMTFN